MATLKDIAKATGVSVATVSYVINNGPREVAPATRERVLAAIREYNYRPNAAARGLRGKSTDTFGVVFPHVVTQPFDNTYFAPIVAGILDTATERSFSCMLYTGVDWVGVEANASVYTDGRCDGLIVMAVPKESPLIKALSDFGIPFVLVGTHPAQVEANTVDTDNVQGAMLATLHLLDLGHRRIGMIQGNADSSSNDERTRGFFLAHEKRGVPADPDLIIPSVYSEDAAYASAVIALSREPEERPTALFCGNDMLAQMIYVAAEEFGLQIPNDLSVVGFDDYAFAQGLVPGLTTIRQPLRAIGAQAAEILLSRIRNPEIPPASLLFEPKLIVRNSTAPFTEPG